MQCDLPSFTVAVAVAVTLIMSIMNDNYVCAFDDFHGPWMLLTHVGICTQCETDGNVL
jgi:hypothetical protein